ncbi:type III secretion system chaperone protein SscB [Variovorax sp. PBS-H4]|uniref:CDC27 family protein n=1 Tax=Variovorax sp. PBS-H4 TaxID=434008 RepID=UPI0013175AAE|nr:CDC27 family protein [Variovorax sp. PBS-H4]VTU40842.1 type III secretion system chaperone protein SscB [Variovorax sp. PBS-H4]
MIDLIADPELSATVRSSLQRLHSISRRSPPETDSPPSPADASTLFARAEQLCTGEDYRCALPLAMELFMALPHEPSAAFLLATCLQRLEQPALAARLFQMCTAMEGDKPTPGALFRAGECLVAMGEKDEALTAFEAAVEIARSDARHSEIQAMAQDKANALRSLEVPILGEIK